MPIYSDSKAVIHIARNPVFHEYTKHVDRDCHFVRQQFLSGLISLSFVPSRSQLADLFTKPLSGPSHKFILGKLGVSSISSNSRGDDGIRSPSHHCSSSILTEEQANEEERDKSKSSESSMCLAKLSNKTIKGLIDKEPRVQITTG